jgi:DNA-binding Lrp family transcriptional regulator
MTNVRKFDIEEAKRMRQEGMSFAEISQQLGCSVAWCSKELRNVEKGSIKRDEFKVEFKKEVIAQLQDLISKVRKM